MTEDEMHAQIAAMRQERDDAWGENEVLRRALVRLQDNRPCWCSAESTEKHTVPCLVARRLLDVADQIGGVQPTPPKFSVSSDGEQYCGTYDSVEEATAALAGCAGWVGKVISAEQRLDVKPEYVEGLIDEIDSDLGETMAAADRVIRLDAEDARTLAAIMAAFIRRHARFDWFSVENPIRIEPKETRAIEEGTSDEHA